jgi:hypothetical protein
MQIKTMMIYLHMPIRKANINNFDYTKCKGEGAENLSLPASGNVNMAQPLWESVAAS